MRRVIASGVRYRLVVVKDERITEEPNVLDVGREVADVIGRIGRKYGQSEIKFQIEVAEAVERIVKQHIFKDDELGGVVVLYNVGILFEPELHLDVVGLLKRISKNSLTVLMWPGSIDAQKLFFLDKNSEIKINQSDINYTII